MNYRNGCPKREDRSDALPGLVMGRMWPFVAPNAVVQVDFPSGVCVTGARGEEIIVIILH